MNKNRVYALDFDGVLCDSALETGMAAWKTAIQLWREMRDVPPEPFIEQFRRARPILETGYEALLMLRLLFQGESAESLLEDFTAMKQSLIEREMLDIKQLKNLFGATRDVWIQECLDEWLRLNPLFPGVEEKLRRLSTQGVWYILTTKQERFVSAILNAHHISIPEQHIYGLDRNLPKETVLCALREQHPGTAIYFVEDRLAALTTVMQNPHLQDLHLQLANWGYNTLRDQREAEFLGIEIIGLEQFII